MARRLQSLSSLALNNINLDSESDYDTDEVEATRLHLDEGEAGKAQDGPPTRPACRPRLPELDSSDAESNADSNDGTLKHKVVRRKKRSQAQAHKGERLSLDFDKTPTQDNVNVNGMFFAENGQFPSMSASFSEYGNYKPSFKSPTKFKKSFDECVLDNDLECTHISGHDFRSTREGGAHSSQIMFFCGHDPHCQIVNGEEAFQCDKQNLNI